MKYLLLMIAFPISTLASEHKSNNNSIQPRKDALLAQLNWSVGLGKQLGVTTGVVTVCSDMFKECSETELSKLSYYPLAQELYDAVQAVSGYQDQCTNIAEDAEQRVKKLTAASQTDKQTLQFNRSRDGYKQFLKDHQNMSPSCYAATHVKAATLALFSLAQPQKQETKQ